MKIPKFSLQALLRHPRKVAKTAQNKVPLAGTAEHLLAMTRGRVLIGGDLVYASLSTSQSGAQTTAASMRAIPDLIDQPSREVYSGLLSRLSKANPRVKVRVHRSAVANNKLRVGFLLDGYLAWGRKHAKGKVAVLGGIALRQGFRIDVLVFEDGKLVSLFDQNLPSKDEFSFNGHLHSMISNIRAQHENVKIVTAAPLDDLTIPDVIHIGGDPLTYIRFAALRTADKQPNAFFVPMGIAGTAVAVFAGTLTLGIAKLKAEEAAHDQAAAAPEIAQRGGKMDVGSVTVMTQRQQFMDAGRAQQEYTRTMARVVRGIKPIKDVVVGNMIVPAPEGDKAAESAGSPQSNISVQPRADVRLVLSLPIVGDSGYEQGVGVVDMLSATTHMSWRLVPRGVTEDGKRRTFTLEGYIHG